jgi:DeoR family transcriptional regulator, fructose operon transcriptional repressor
VIGVIAVRGNALTAFRASTTSLAFPIGTEHTRSGSLTDAERGEEFEGVEQPLPPQRHRRIQELLRERQAVRVGSLAELLAVSEVTIRRDLEELERRGLLERTHGGAILAQRLRSEPAWYEAVSRNAAEKCRIGEAAAGLVQPHDTIFLNGGTTTLEVFRHLRASDVRVVSNHLGMAQEAADRSIELVLVGGEFRPPSSSCVGVFATETLRRVFASKVFLGVEGLSPRSGLTTPAASEAEVARVMIEQTTGDVVVVADRSKIGTVADFAIAPLNRVTHLVTDAGVDDDLRGELASLGVDVVVAGESVTIVGAIHHG